MSCECGDWKHLT